MVVTIIVLAQVGAGVAAADAVTFDLRTVVAPPCASGGSEIVICGHARGDEAFRLRALPPSGFDPKPLRAQIGIGSDATMGVGGEQAKFGNGSVSNRVMVRLKKPF